MHCSEQFYKLNYRAKMWDQYAPVPEHDWKLGLTQSKVY